MISIEVVIPRATVDAVYPVLVRCCREAGDVLLGRRDDPHTAAVLGVVHLTDDRHVSTLGTVHRMVEAYTESCI